MSQDEAQHALPQMDFATFVLSLGSSVLVHLEQIPGSDGDESDTNLTMAKQAIDIIAMLEEKTKGNLDESETKLISGLLYDLRIKFVDAQKNAKAG